MNFSKLKFKKWNKKWVYEVEVPITNKFIFIHIPKTGGTTFRFILYNHFKSKDIYPTQKELKNNGGQYLKQNSIFKEKNLINKSMIIGHFKIEIFRNLETVGSKKMAFFRNPLDRVLSMIKHLKTHREEYQNTNINVVLEQNWNRILYGQSTAMGFDFKLKQRLQQNVRINIINLDFIGITEYFEESIQLCNATFNWKLENIEPRNVLSQEIFSQLSVKSKIRISKELHVELNTYNIALNHFKLRCKKHNIKLPY